MCKFKDTSLGIKKLDFGVKRGAMATCPTDGREVIVPPDIKRLSRKQREEWMIMDKILPFIMKRSYFLIFLSLLLVLFGCKSNHITEEQRFEKSIRKQLPFRVDTVHWLSGTDVPTFKFSNGGYTAAPPDVEIRPDGVLVGSNIFGMVNRTRQEEENIWRNVIVSRKSRRIICIDRYLRQGKTVGYCYVFQSEHKKYPTFGTFHWDVSDGRNMDLVGEMLTDLRKLAMKRHQLAYGELEAPTSQSAYWQLIFHADSLFDAHLYDEARQVYDLAFTEDRYILPSQLSATARKMADVGNSDIALAYLRHRMAMEKDFYENPSMCSFAELKDTFENRSRQYHYDLNLKEQLEYIFERDQYDRLLWLQTMNRHPVNPERTEQLALRALATDSMNLALVSNILEKRGFPRKDQVGDMGVQAVWMVFQHAGSDQQERFLPQLEEAVARGDIDPAFLAMLKDRIDVREGRPQKYGTQMNDKGQLAPLLDASRLNEWRQEVGLPPIEN